MDSLAVFNSSVALFAQVTNSMANVKFRCSEGHSFVCRKVYTSLITFARSHFCVDMSHCAVFKQMYCGLMCSFQM